MSHIHNPSQFIPTDYTVVDYIDLNEYNDAVQCLREALVNPDQSVQREAHAELKALKAAINARNLRYFGTTENPEKCDHCGNKNCRYFGVALHKPTATHIAIGHTCAVRVELTVDEMKFKQLAERAEATRTLCKRDAILAGFADTEPALYEALMFAKRSDKDMNGTVQKIADAHGLKTDEAHAVIRKSVSMLCDIGTKVRNYDYKFASEKQKEFFLSASKMSKCIEWAKQAEENVNKRGERDALQISAPVLSGRVTVTGKFVSVRDQSSDFGTVWKGLFVCDTHQKVWLTVPQSVLSMEGVTTQQSVCGIPLTLKVTLEPSKDAGFYFGKRPTLVTA